MMVAPFVQRCKSCQQVIRWKKTQAGKAIPLDPDPSEKGNIAIANNGDAVILNQQEIEDYNLRGSGLLYVCHFATCPYAHVHRKKKD